MPACVIEIEVTDTVFYAPCEERRRQVAASAGAPPPRTVAPEFPDRARLQAWFGAPERAPLVVPHQRFGRGSQRAVEGVST